MGEVVRDNTGIVLFINNPRAPRIGPQARQYSGMSHDPAMRCGTMIRVALNARKP